MTWRPLNIPEKEDLETCKYPSIIGLGDLSVSLYNPTRGPTAIPT